MDDRPFEDAVKRQSAAFIVLCLAFVLYLMIYDSWAGLEQVSIYLLVSARQKTIHLIH